MTGKIEYINVEDLLNDFSEAARIWIYTSNRQLSNQEVFDIHQELNTFLNEWNTHGTSLTSTAFVLHNIFLFFVVEEEVQYASGCSIDSKVNFVKNLGNKLNIDFFDRFRFVYRDGENMVYNLSKSQFSDLYKIGKITDDTIVFDPLINTVKKYKSDFEKPLAKSWHHKFID